MTTRTRDTDRTTPARFQTALRVLEAWRAIAAGEDALEAMHSLMLDVIEPRLRELYEWVVSGADDERPFGEVVSADVQQAWQRSKEDAATMLSQLCELGLLERVEERDSLGRRFVYGMPGMVATREAQDVAR